MARLTYPRAAEPRPAALPPAERTVGQLVAESIRIYGERFVRCLAIGVPPAALALVTAHVSRNVTLLLAPTLYGAALSASYVAACVLVLERRPATRRLVLAWAAGWLAFVPVPFLVLAFVLPGLAWLAAVGLVVPVLVVEETSARRAFARAWQLARAGYVHVLGSLATLAIVVFLTQSVLAFILRGAGGTAVSTAFVLANVVISPLLFVGAALLYVDQSARVEYVPGMAIYILLSRLSQQGVATLKSNPDRLREVNKDVEELGAKVLHQWATLGEFDFVNVVEAPDTATIARVSIALGARGSTRVETLPALTIDEFVATLS